MMTGSEFVASVIPGSAKTFKFDEKYNLSDEAVSTLFYLLIFIWQVFLCVL